MQIRNVYDFGDLVYLKVDCQTDPEEAEPGCVTGITVRPNMSISYEVTWPDRNETGHYDFELCSSKFAVEED